MTIDITFWIICILISTSVILSVLPFIPLPHGIFRVWEFPRIQIFLTSVVCFLLTLILVWDETFRIYLICASAAAAIIQLAHIARFTPFWRRRSAEYSGGNRPIVKLLISNVKMGNRDYQKTADLIDEYNPDIAVFMETDQPWIDALSEATSGFEYRAECPIANGYGLMVVSKFRFHDEKIRYLLNPEVPSFDGMIEHPDGKKFRLVVVHPEPPMASADTMGRDAEIAFVGNLVRHDDDPVIVTGDLNDVAWSRTTRRFLRISRLLDPREGRGQFNTFDARYFFLRWPLDHIFHSPHFQLVSMKRLRFTGSDHFPMLYELALTAEEVGRREVDQASDADLDEAKELISVEKDRERRPVGHDWEPKNDQPSS